ncbi:MAG: cytochrome c, partial [Gammaproteobacteria bacterium]|nr:cytochrome c [Gammaproteobacteria bacterium]
MIGCAAPPRARATAPALFSLTLIGLSPSAPAGDAAAVAYPQGAEAFQANCAVCHGPAGAGVPSLAPPLLSYPARYATSAEG